MKDRPLAIAGLLGVLGLLFFAVSRSNGSGVPSPRDAQVAALRAAVGELNFGDVAVSVAHLNARIESDRVAREAISSRKALSSKGGQHGGGGLSTACGVTYNGQASHLHCETIFVSVASFRDPICPITVRELIIKAFNPRRVFVGALEQHEGEDSCFPKEFDVPTEKFPNGDCKDPLQWCPRDNVRVRRVKPKDAKGPTFGRFVSSLLYRGEKYYMMIDSHNRFLVQWDRVLIENYIKAPSPKKVLSHYPNGYDVHKPNPMDESVIMVMCKAIWIHEIHYPRNGAEWMPSRDKPYPQSFTAAGFLFGDAAFMHEVPFDPYLDYLFDGEELMYTVRLWTHGWDIYGPSKAVLFHSYDRHDAKRYWHEPGMPWVAGQRISQQRVQYFLKSVYQNTTTLVIPDKTKVDARVSQQESVFGLGSARTLEQFWQHVGIDWSKRTDGHEKCDVSRRS